MRLRLFVSPHVLLADPPGARLPRLFRQARRQLEGQVQKLMRENQAPEGPRGPPGNVGRPTGEFWGNHRKTMGNHRKTHVKLDIYPLVKVYITMENHDFCWGTSLFL